MPFNLLSSIIGGAVSNDWQTAHDKEMYQMQRKDYLADRHHSEEYNSPEAQVQRLKDAGLNPSLAMSNIQTGSINSPSAPNAQANAMSKVQGSNLTDNILRMMNAKSDLAIKNAEAKRISADAKLAEIDAETRSRENLERITSIINKGKKDRADADATDYLSSIQYNKFLSSIGVDASLAAMNFALEATQWRIFQGLPIEQSLNWIEKVANIQESYSRQEVNKQQVKKMIEETTSVRFGWKGQKWMNELNEKTEDLIIRKRRLDGVPKNPYEFGGAGIQEFYDGLKSLW